MSDWWIINSHHEVIKVASEMTQGDDGRWYMDGQPGWFWKGSNLFNNEEDAKLRAIERVLGYALEHGVPVREQYVSTACNYAKEFREKIDEMQRLPEEEDPIAVSQQFDLEQKGPWIVHGRNGNRNPKIAYLETREEAEELATRVRQVIAVATLPLKAKIDEARCAAQNVADYADPNEVRKFHERYYWWNKEEKTMPDMDGYLTDKEVIVDGVVWEVRELKDTDYLCEAWIDDETECPNVAVVELHHWGDEDYHCVLPLCEECLERLTRAGK